MYKTTWCLEPLMQREVSQKEKDKYHILIHIYMESRKMEFISLAENGLADTVEEGEGGMS